MTPPTSPTARVPTATAITHPMSATSPDAVSDDCNANLVPDECEVATRNGLAGAYYDGDAFTGLLRGRLDPTVDFGWAAGAPWPQFDIDNFSIRWTGYVITPAVAGTYAFYTTTDDDACGCGSTGNCSSISGSTRAQTEWSGPIDLAADTAYRIVMEYYENGRRCRRGIALAAARTSQDDHSRDEPDPGSRLQTPTAFRIRVIFPPAPATTPTAMASRTSANLWATSTETATSISTT